mmetsp:Transcript_111797/g.238811  ORF Transcript_111797/g.238811 Transcript_111797/m.238811 type:complete len:309 (-) Transcript_111797:1467-2393(-)
MPLGTDEGLHRFSVRGIGDARRHAGVDHLAGQAVHLARALTPRCTALLRSEEGQDDLIHLIFAHFHRLQQARTHRLRLRLQDHLHHRCRHDQGVSAHLHDLFRISFSVLLSLRRLLRQGVKPVLTRFAVAEHAQGARTAAVAFSRRILDRQVHLFIGRGHGGTGALPHLPHWERLPRTAWDRQAWRTGGQPVFHDLGVEASGLAPIVIIRVVLLIGIEFLPILLFLLRHVDGVLPRRHGDLPEGVGWNCDGDLPVLRLVLARRPIVAVPQGALWGRPLLLSLAVGPLLHDGDRRDIELIIFFLLVDLL